ncbi:MAG: hypothetical protein MSA19_12490 [Butyricimonas virosa]|uniref:DUF6850 family outer membrane beta-barrel protein n=1 Tax=Butyricimonas virosa TaxID=544645 RepID=UPI00242BE2C8|nr:DUF6850 family outer membrane beta-barrel protein [Butyricimonas virosa]MCI7164195.1 hypothetical protein [Butyricimonas virosa]MDY5013484.1 hypothetical protein [Butyricimonas virosa]
MYNKYIYLCFMLFVSVIGRSQTSTDTVSVVTPEMQRLELVKQLWLPTRNASGLGFDPVADHGDAWFGVFHSSGDYHRAQEGSRVNGLSFLAERYSKIARNLYVWGSFKFTMDRESERAWSDVILKEYTSPYQYGGSVKGSYDRQLFDLKVKFATGSIGRFTFGAEVDYSVGDLSRLRDPRSRVLLADYAIIPSLTYKISEKHALGLDFYYRFRKQHLDNIITVQREKQFEYYLLEGLENYWMTTELGKVARRTVADIFGGDLQYKLTGEYGSWLVSLGYERLVEEVVDDERKEPGDYNAQKVTFYSGYKSERINVLHAWNMQASYTGGQAEEFVQEQVNITHGNGMVSNKWVTLYNFVTYKDDVLNVQTDYTFYKGDVSRKDYNWLMGVSGKYEYLKNRYLLPESTREVSTLRIGVKGAGRVVNKDAHKFWIEAALNGALPLETKMNLSEENVFTENVLNPDLRFFKAKTLEAKVDFQYSFPMRLKKTALTGYIKAYAGNVFTDKFGSRFSGGISVGILTL